MRAIPLLLGLAGLIAAAEPPPVIAAPEEGETNDEARERLAAKCRREAQARSPQPIEVLTVGDLARSPATTLPDRFRTVPGVSVYQLRSGQYEVGLRGWNGVANNRILVTLDDQALRSEEQGVVTWIGALMQSNLESVSISKGPSSVVHGSNAFGGVFALRSRTPGDQHSLRVVGSAGPGSLDGDATAAGPLSATGLDYAISLGATSLDDLDGPRSGQVRQASTRTSHSGSADLDAWRSAIRLGAKLPAELRAELAWRRTDFDPWEIVDGASTGSARTEQTFDAFEAVLRHPLLTVSWQHEITRIDYQNQKPLYDPSIDFAYLQFGFADRRDTVSARSEHLIGQQRLVIGGEFMEWSSRSNLWQPGTAYGDPSTWARVSTSNRALFLEDAWAITPAWISTVGLRGDDHSRVGLRASPRVAVQWLPGAVPGAEDSVLFSYSTGYRQPSGLEQYQHDYFLQPDDGIGAESIHAVELQWRHGGDEISWSLGGFANRANHLIWRLPLPLDQQQANFARWLAAGAPPNQAPGPVFRYENLDNPVTVLGGEASLRVAMPGTGFALWTNATVQRFRYRREVRISNPGLTAPGLPVFYRFDFTLPRDVNGPPDWLANIGLDYAQRSWFAAAVGRFVGPRYVYDLGHSLFLTTPSVASQSLPPTAVADLMIGYHLTRTAFLKASVMDLFDSGHAEHLQATPQSLSLVGEDQLAGNLGRTIRLNVGMTF